MWKKPWSLKEGFLIGGGLCFSGLLIQLSAGPINWSAFAFPVNIIIIALLLIALFVMHSLRLKFYFIRWHCHYSAAVASISWVAIITVVMGLTKQVPPGEVAQDPLGLSDMLTSWSFVLLYAWLTIIIGLLSIKHIMHFKLKKIPFLLNHLGLFIAIVAGTLGNADLQRLEMVTQLNVPEWRAKDKFGNLHELPIAIELKKFQIKEYPPKLLLIENKNGEALPLGKPQNISLETDKGGKLLGYDVKVLKRIEYAAPVPTKEDTKFVEWMSRGATYAALIEVHSKQDKTTKRGWVSAGSFLFPYEALRLSDKYSIVMPDREPEKYSSNVQIYTKSGQNVNVDIEVNKPAKVENWKIYQLSYDEKKGPWSEVSVFELVSDPWLPVVYVGIIMMIAGAVVMFVTAQQRKGVM